MKKVFALLLFFAASYEAICQSYSDSFSLQLRFEPKMTIHDARLLSTEGEELVADKVTHKIRGSVNSFGIFTLSVTCQLKGRNHNDSYSIPIFIQPGETFVLVNELPSQCVVTGASKDNYEKYKSLLAKDDAAFKKVMKSKSRLSASLKTANRDLISKYRKEVAVSEEERNNLYLDYIRKNPRSLVAVYAVNLFGSINVEHPFEVEKAIRLLDDSLQATKEISELLHTVAAYKKIAVGQPAPEIAQPDTSGKIIAIKDLRGKYVLIDFWASWCKPCRAANPALVALYDRFKSNDFVIVGVSLDSYKAAWTKAITDDKLAWPQISDLKGWKNEAALEYNINSVPQNYLLDQNGIIIAKNLSPDELSNTIDKLFPKNQ